MKWRVLAGLALVLLLVIAVWQIFGHGRRLHGGPHMHGREASSGAIVGVKVPTLSEAAVAGKAIFEEHCAACHGQDAAGVDGAGPPLVHIIYEPGHHADLAFRLAAKQGVRQHHWKFGNMPPVPGATDDDVGKIIIYVRELQRANGIQ